MNVFRWRETHPIVDKGNPWTWTIVAKLDAPRLVVASRPSRVVNFAQGHLADAPKQDASIISRRQWLLTADAIAAALCSALLFGQARTTELAWLLHVLSVLLLVFSFFPFSKIARVAPLSRTQLTTQLLYALPVVIVLALAAAVRLWQLDEFPFGNWADEASNGLAAIHILEDSTFRPVFIQDTLLPAHFNYLLAFSFSLFGVGVTAIRIVTAAFGIAAVFFAYLLFRRWFGQGMGIVAACLLAVMRYHLTFSRFGMHGIATPAFELAGLYFLDRALAEKKVSDFMWLGLTVGFGLAFYFAFRLFPVVLVVFLGCLAFAALMKYGVRETNRRFVQGMWRQWLITLVALGIALTPVLQFAARNPQEFFSRTSATSIFQNRSEPDLAKAYWNNLVKHLEMFTVRGDNNGRHNLPGEPMLDPVMGLLFLVGVALAVVRVRDPASFLMLLLFVVALHGGILSLDFEAPQSLRSIGVIPALVYFITLPLALAGHVITRIVPHKSLETSASSKNGSSQNWAMAAWGVFVLLVLVTVSYLNLDLFFNKQKNDPSASAQYSIAETLVAKEMKRLASTHDFVVTALYSDSPTVRFLAHGVTNLQSWTVTDHLPLVRDTERGIVIFLDEKLMSAYREAQVLYPNAQFQQIHQLGGGDGIVLWQVTLSPEDLRAAQGVVVRYSNGDTEGGTVAKEEVLSQVAVDWTQTQPLTQPFTAELESTLYAEDYGEYRFEVRGDSTAKLWIDEYPVAAAPIMLARGTHALRMQVSGGEKKVELWWQTPKLDHPDLVPARNLFRAPITNNGLLGTYYRSPDWSGPPALAQIDPELDYYFHVIPLPRPYSVRWEGKLEAPASGEYKFAIQSIDGARLLLDNRLVVDNPDGGGTTENTIQLTEGLHDILVYFADKTAATRIYLYWTPPGAPKQELVPMRALLPPMGRYPDAVK